MSYRYNDSYGIQPTIMVIPRGFSLSYYIGVSLCGNATKSPTVPFHTVLFHAARIPPKALGEGGGAAVGDGKRA
jgi:hypothetical protein